MTRMVVFLAFSLFSISLFSEVSTDLIKKVDTINNPNENCEENHTIVRRKIELKPGNVNLPELGVNNKRLQREHKRVLRLISSDVKRELERQYPRIVKRSLRNGYLRVDELTDKIRKELGLSSMDIDALVMLVMAEAAKDQSEDLKDMINEMQSINKKKQAQRELIKSLRDIKKGIKDEFKASAAKRLTVTAKVRSIDKSSSRVGMVYKTVGHDEKVYKINRLCVANGKWVCGHEIKEKLIETAEKNIDSIGAISERLSIRLQMLMDRRSKFMSTLSQMMKKISTTQDTLIQNIK